MRSIAPFVQLHVQPRYGPTALRSNRVTALLHYSAIPPSGLLKFVPKSLVLAQASLFMMQRRLSRDGGHVWAEYYNDQQQGWIQVDVTGGGELACGLYHIPYFTFEDGELPMVYLSLPTIEQVPE